MIEKKMGFENLVPVPSLNRDSNGDGIVDGYTYLKYPGTEVEFLFDPTEKAQIINHLGNTGNEIGYDGIQGDDFFPITVGQIYTLSAEIKGDGPFDGLNGPRVLVRWYDADKKFISGFGLAPVLSSEWFRASRQIEPPEGAAYARIKPDFVSRPGFPGGMAWYRNVQLEIGDTITEYEENDFFSMQDQFRDGTVPIPGWERTDQYKITGYRGYVVAKSNGTNPGRINDGEHAKSSFSFTVPPEADNISLTFWADLSRINDESALAIYLGDSDLNLFPYEILQKAPEPQKITIPVPRGETRIDLVYAQNGAPVGDETPVIDDISVTWDVVEPEPEPVPVKDADRSQILTFDEEETPAFFKVREKADGYDYGFQRTAKQRKSGYYSLGVKNPEEFVDGEKAGAAIEFSIPQTARNPRMSFSALLDGSGQRAVGRVLLNGDVIAEFREDTGGWEEISAIPIAGENTLLIEYEVEQFSFDFSESIYIDDVIVSYDLARRPVMIIGTGPETTISTESRRVSVTEGFENPGFDPFFTVRNPGNLRSGGGPSDLPEEGWERTTKISRNGKYSFKSKHEKLTGTEDASVDFIFRVPYGAKNPVFECWNYVETRRSTGPIDGEKYPRLFNEFRIWVNGVLWKEFIHASPELTRSVKYSAFKSGDPANDYACPYGKWWPEAFYLTPGKSYTITFESQLRTIRSGIKTTVGKNIMAVDDVRVYWDETPGDVVTTPVEPLIYLDNRDGYRWVEERGGAEMPPLSFAETEMFGQPGSLHQFTKIEPRTVDITVRITADTREELRKKIRNLTSQIANRPLGLQVIYPEGDERTLLCRFTADPIWSENRETRGVFWRKVVLSFRAFDPFWYSEKLVVDGADLQDPKWVPVSNHGDFRVWPFIKIYGPIVNPKITLTGNSPESTVESESMTVEVAVPAGRYLVIDPRPGQKVLMLDDGTNLYSFMTIDSKFFSIPDGDHGIKLTGSATDTKTKLVAEYMVPYWGV